MGIIGRVVSSVVGVAGDVFYRRRMLAGSVPLSGPVLLVANHPNGLIDPILVQQAAGRRVRMLAKAPLFSMPGISILVRALDCLPVYRAKDGADTKQNADTFRAVEDALVGGDCVLIFPEGISHDEPQLQPLKTGAARMALGAVERGAVDLQIVPIGLTYADKLRYRSTAAVEVGVPIAVRPFLPDAPRDDEALRNAARKLTTAIDDALRAVTVNVESWHDVPLLDAVDAIWRQEDPERTRRVKNLADGVQRLRTTAPTALEDVRTRLSGWVDALAAAGLTPRDVARDGLRAVSPANRWAMVGRHLGAALFALPLALFGAVFWAVPFWGVHAVWWRMRPERDVGATVKVLAALVLFPLWFLGATAALAFLMTPVTAGLVAVVAPGAGLTTRHYLRRRGFAVRALLGAWRARLRGRALEELLTERDALCRAFDALVDLVEAADVAGNPDGNRTAAGGVRSPDPGTAR
jgi:glycerol-3-phosphate O-acyltransferase/dihydroxyacetone phosphate acyltransferase